MSPKWLTGVSMSKVVSTHPYTTPVRQSPVRQLWKESLFSLLVKVARGVFQRWVETTLDIGYPSMYGTCTYFPTCTIKINHSWIGKYTINTWIYQSHGSYGPMVSGRLKRENDLHNLSGHHIHPSTFQRRKDGLTSPKYLTARWNFRRYWKNTKGWW